LTLLEPMFAALLTLIPPQQRPEKDFPLCQQHRLKSQGLVKLGENVKRKNEDLQAEIKGANKDGCGGRISSRPYG
jgi:hypothetical protein